MTQELDAIEKLKKRSDFYPSTAREAHIANSGWNDCLDFINRDYVLVKRADVPSGLEASKLSAEIAIDKFLSDGDVKNHMLNLVEAAALLVGDEE